MQDRRKPGISGSFEGAEFDEEAGRIVGAYTEAVQVFGFHFRDIDRSGELACAVERFALAKRATASASSRKAGFKLGSAANLAKRVLKFSRPVRRVSFTAHAPRTNI